MCSIVTIVTVLFCNMYSIFQIIQECGCVSGQILHAQKMLKKNEYCTMRMEDTAQGDTTFIKRMNCSFYLKNSLLKYTDCDCPISCKETLYRYRITQSPWPHLSYHLPLYKHLIRKMSFKDHFSEYYEPLAKIEFINESLIYPELRKTDLISRNFIQVHVKMESDLLVKYVEKEAMSWESFIGGIGGLLNLWTGITFFALLELLELIYTLVWPTGGGTK